MSALRASSCALLIGAAVAPLLLGRSEPSMRRLPDLVAAAVSSSEYSGLEASRAHQGVYWTHNDSGGDARLFAFDEDGNELWPAGTDADSFEGFALAGARNIDWEDLCLVGDSIWVADMGNNFNTRTNLGLYEWTEPDPRSSEQLGAARFHALVYPEQTEFPPERDWAYDSESLFEHAGKLHLLTKHRRMGEDGRARLQNGTRLYSVTPGAEGAHLALRLLGSNDDIPPPTAADVSPNGERLAVLVGKGGRPAPLELWLFDAPSGAAHDNWLASPPRVVSLPPRDVGPHEQNPLRDAEAMCWVDDERVRVLTEHGVWIEVRDL